MSVASKRLKIIFGAVGVVLSAGVLSFGPLVRYEVAQAGARHGARVTVERIWPTWGGVRLKGVDVSIADIPSLHARVAEVEVAFGSNGRRIVVRGGEVEATGPREELIDQVEAWRAKNSRAPTEPSAASESKRNELDVGGFSLKWQDNAAAPTESVAATDVRIDHDGERIDVRAGTANVHNGGVHIDTKDALLGMKRIDGRFKVAQLTVAAVDGTWTLPPVQVSSDESASTAAPSASARAPIPSPSARKVSHRTPNENGAGAVALDASSLERRLTDGVGRLVALAKTIDDALAEKAVVSVESVHAKIEQGSDVLHVGTGKLTVSHADGTLAVDLSPSGVANPSAPGGAASPTPSQQQALTFRLQVPVRDNASSQDIVADVRGGPIWLSTLGIRDGDFGLFEVSRAALSMNAHVTLSADRTALRVEGDGKLASLSISNKALSDEPIAGLDLAWKGKASARLDRRRIDVDEGEIDLGQIRLLTAGSYERSGDEHRVRASLDVPLVGCQAALDSLPKGLVARLAGMRMAGTFALKGKVAFDTARIERDFQVNWDTAVSCRVTEAPPAVDVSRFSKSFEHVVYTPDGLAKTIETGPGTANWVAYSGISKFMSVAVLTTEDGGFYRHRGFDAEAIKNSIRENLKKRKFVRGASTISMQLAKNLYLDRAKNVSRKLQEALLTMYLEQVLTKDQIMELYLNVIELGPMVYGVGAAAQHYFRTEASQLSLGQALYLSSIMPNPKVDHFMPQGPVRPSWMGFLHKLMEIARKRDRITDEELEEGLRETVVRGSPAPFRAPKSETPREPTPGGTDEPEEPAWTAP
ncbi:MAG: transglycosylase domain-containing protein [Polyangiaceae bacterium]|nr:transglycosylase domain-containing protein [Polyangiaceae bacterium]